MSQNRTMWIKDLTACFVQSDHNLLSLQKSVLSSLKIKCETKKKNNKKREKKTPLYKKSRKKKLCDLIKDSPTSYFEWTMD